MIYKIDMARQSHPHHTLFPQIQAANPECPKAYDLFSINRSVENPRKKRPRRLEELKTPKEIHSVTFAVKRYKMRER
jgi:hypothetical protein